MCHYSEPLSVEVLPDEADSTVTSLPAARAASPIAFLRGSWPLPSKKGREPWIRLVPTSAGDTGVDSG
jgi:hypothetical protein